jgi:hypothetical protein
MTPSRWNVMVMSPPPSLATRSMLDAITAPTMPVSHVTTFRKSIVVAVREEPYFHTRSRRAFRETMAAIPVNRLPILNSRALG